MQPHRVVAGAGRELLAVARAATPTHERLRDRLTVVVLATVGVTLVCAVLALLLERNAEGSEIHNFGTAVFWTTTQLLTVSSQLRNPISTGARILDVFMEFYAITVVATLAGSLGAFFIKRGEELEKQPPRAG